MDALGLMPKTQTVKKDGYVISVVQPLERRFDIAQRAWLVAFPRADLPVKLPLPTMDGLSLQWIRGKNIWVALYAKDPQKVTLPDERH